MKHLNTERLKNSDIAVSLPGLAISRDQSRSVESSGTGPAVARVQLFSNCRAMTMRWISLVPSPMVQSLASR